MGNKLHKNDPIYVEARNTFGVNTQLLVSIEEFSELQKELTKYLRFNPNYDMETIYEEIADAEIMLEQLKEIFECHEEIKEYKEKKKQRLVKKIEELKDNKIVFRFKKKIDQ